MTRLYNFSAGPSALPESVLKRAAGELLEYKSTGMSVMEMSHRSPEFDQIIKHAEELLRDLMSIPSTYKVLFLQGGASIQFAMVPLNLFRKNKKMDIIHTGEWTKRAIAEAKKYGTVNVIASSEDEKFTCIPAFHKDAFSKDADYFHICTNNTIEGTRFSEIPDTGDVPLIADMSSNILSEQYDVNKFALIFAGAQKNIGPAGLTVVIIREDLIGHAMDVAPTMLDYKTHSDNRSLYNTPPTYGIYMAMLVFEWLKDLGGVSVMQKMNEEKSALIYDFLDNSSMFRATIRKGHRSMMNIPFVSGSRDLDDLFLKEAAKNGLVNLKGHRIAGGMRASIYNPMPIEGVKKLVNFMKEFELKNK